MDIIRPVVRVKPCITSGSHECRGANPIFRARARIRRSAEIGWVSCRRPHCPVSQALVAAANNSIAAPAACTRKYLVADSTARGWWSCAISGIIARVLISMPIQAMSQWELVKTSVVPRPSPIIRAVRMYGFISKGGILTVMFGL